MALGMIALLVLGCTSPEPGTDSGTDTAQDTTDSGAGELDSDGDGYSDADEALAGTDPDDPDDRIYTGGWPFNAHKDDLSDPGFDGTIAVGARVPRLVALDQYGDTVDLYDFAGSDVPVVLDLSAMWCGPCTEVAAWLAHEESPLMANFPVYAGIPDRVDAGEVLWVTVLFEDTSRDPASQEDAATWHQEWPAERVPVMLDDDRAMFDWIVPGSYPTLLVLDAQLEVQVFDRFTFTPALDALIE